MIVTNIEAVTKAKSRVYIEEQLAFVLYKGELSRYKIRLGSTVSQEVYEEIMNEILVKRAKTRCLYLLKSMDRTEHQLRSKLRQGDYPAKVIDAAIEYVRGYHYIDDTRYAEYYINARKGSKSRRQITQDLLQKGVSKEVIEDIFSRLAPADETAMIKKWVEKKRVDLKEADHKELNRLYAFLMRKGFASSDISRVLRMREEFD